MQYEFPKKLSYEYESRELTGKGCTDPKTGKTTYHVHCSFCDETQNPCDHDRVFDGVYCQLCNTLTSKKLEYCHKCWGWGLCSRCEVPLVWDSVGIVYDELGEPIEEQPHWLDVKPGRRCPICKLFVEEVLEETPTKPETARCHIGPLFDIGDRVLVSGVVWEIEDFAKIGNEYFYSLQGRGRITCAEDGLVLYKKDYATLNVGDAVWHTKLQSVVCIEEIRKNVRYGFKYKKQSGGDSAFTNRESLRKILHPRKEIGNCVVLNRHNEYYKILDISFDEDDGGVLMLQSLFAGNVFRMPLTIFESKFQYTVEK